MFVFLSVFTFSLIFITENSGKILGNGFVSSLLSFGGDAYCNGFVSKSGCYDRLEKGDRESDFSSCFNNDVNYR